MQARFTLREDDGTVITEQFSDWVDLTGRMQGKANYGFEKVHIKCIPKDVYNCAEILFVGDGKLSNVSLRGSVK